MRTFMPSALSDAPYGRTSSVSGPNVGLESTSGASLTPGSVAAITGTEQPRRSRDGQRRERQRKGSGKKASADSQVPSDESELSTASAEVPEQTGPSWWMIGGAIGVVTGIGYYIYSKRK